MTVPFALDEAQVDYDVAQDDGVTDVNTIISTIRALLVTRLGWSEPSTALFKTPVDAASRWFDLLLTRISATNLELRLRNAAGTTLFTRRIQITSGVSVWYHGNIFGVVIASLTGTNEITQAHILDQSPDLQSDNALYVIGNAYRSAADVADGNGSIVGQYYAIDNGAAAVLSRLRRWTSNSNANGGSSTIEFQTITQKFLIRDALAAINSAGTVRWAGRICHAIMLDAKIPFGMRRQPYIDTSTGKNFAVIGLTSVHNMRLAFRSDNND